MNRLHCYTHPISLLLKKTETATATKTTNRKDPMPMRVSKANRFSGVAQMLCFFCFLWLEMIYDRINFKIRDFLITTGDI